MKKVLAILIALVALLGFHKPESKPVQIKEPVNLGSIAVPSAPVSNGMVAWWTFDGQDLIQNAKDRSGTGNTGNLQNQTSTTTITGKIGQALSFDGSRRVVGTNVLNLPKSTFSGWVKISAAPSNQTVLFGLTNGFGSGTFDHVLTIDASRLVDFYVYDNAAQHATAPSALSIGVWHHIVGTNDGTNAVLYIDGVAVASVAAGDAFTGYSVPNLFAGGGFASYDNYTGSLDDIRVYSRALSATEIKTIYRNGQGDTLERTNPGVGSTLSQGLVGHWSFDGSNTLWTSATAGTVNDSSGKGNPGAMTNLKQATNPRAGKVGQSLLFNGTDNYIRVEDSTSLRITSVMTISAWIKVASHDGSFREIVRKNDGSGGYFLVINGFNNAALASSGDSGEYNAGFAYPADNKWHLLTGVYNGTNCIMYLDGVSQTTYACANATADNSPLYISANTGSSQFFAGGLDDVRIYNRALSSSEVTQLYNSGQVTFQRTQTYPASTLSSGLVGYWSFNGQDMIQNATDRSGRGNNGSLVSFTSTTTVPGKVGQALKFDGVDDVVTTSNESSFDFDTANPFTISAWENYTEVGIGSRDIIEKVRNGGNFEGYKLDIDDTNFRVRFFIFGSDNSNINAGGGATTLLANGWHHIVATYDGSGSGAGMKIYQDGAFLTAGTGTLTASPLNNASFQIGLDPTGGGTAYKGLMDEVRVYNRALTPTEITQLYKSGL